MHWKVCLLSIIMVRLTMNLKEDIRKKTVKIMKYFKGGCEYFEKRKMKKIKNIDKDRLKKLGEIEL